MEVKQIDQLFKHKLKTAISEPKAESWDQLEAMLEANRPKGIIVFWKVAAVILILLISAFAIKWNVSDQQTQQLSFKNNQVIPKVNISVPVEIAIDENEKNKEIEIKTVVKEPKVIKKKSSPSFVIQNNDSIDENTEKETPIIELLEVLVAESTDLQDVDDVVEKKKLPIKITFKRNTMQTNDQLVIVKAVVDTANNKGIKEIIDITRQLTPGELMADIRDAKDEFLSDPFNIKKNKVKNSNK